MRRKILRTGLVASALAALALGGNVYERTHEGNALWHQGKYQDHQLLIHLLHLSLLWELI